MTSNNHQFVHCILYIHQSFSSCRHLQPKVASSCATIPNAAARAPGLPCNPSGYRTSFASCLTHTCAGRYYPYCLLSTYESTVACYPGTDEAKAARWLLAQCRRQNEQACDQSLQCHHRIQDKRSDWIPDEHNDEHNAFKAAAHHSALTSAHKRHILYL
jgi:hypothetical protein